MRSNVVLPDPEGPSSATSFPRGTLRSTLSRTLVAPNVLVILEAWMLMRSRSAAGVLPFDQRFEHQGENGQQRQQGRHGKRRDEVVLVVKYLHVQRHRVRLAPDVSAHDRHRAEFAHRAR